VFPDHDTLTCVESEGPDHPQGTDVNIDDLDAVGGPCGQRTFYAKDGFVEVRGSDRPDLLSASYYPTRIYGLGGDDRLFGGTCSRCHTDGGDGNDTLEGGGLMLGGPGNDHFSSAIANSLPVRQDGGPGDDVLVGRYGPDRLVGGPGRDRISGGDGNDYVGALDREADSVNCGAGRDTVLADKADKVKGCERVLRSRPKSRATAARAAAASSSSSGKCRRSSTTGHANVIARSSKAVVFAKRGYYYACLYSGGPIARLLDEGGGITEKGNAGPKFAGGFLAYATEGSAIGDEFDRVVVWDLRTGTVLYEASSTYVDKIVLKSDGAAAWTAASVVGVPDQTSPRSTEVHLFSPGDDLGDMLVDRGSDIDRLSLAPGPRGSTITWTAGGQTRSADWH
jgi:Ca2+-binding RTX toxin-like protein